MHVRTIYDHLCLNIILLYIIYQFAIKYFMYIDRLSRVALGQWTLTYPTRIADNSSYLFLSSRSYFYKFLCINYKSLEC